MERKINSSTGRPFDGPVSIEEARLVLDDYESTDEHIKQMIGFLEGVCEKVIKSEI